MKSWVDHNDNIPREGQSGLRCLKQSQLAQHSRSETKHRTIYKMLASAPL